MSLRIDLPGLRCPNLANQRMHWRARAKLVAAQREAVAYHLLGVDWQGYPRPTAEDPWLVTLTRLGPRELDDDGVVSSLKAVRDAVAAYVGVDDRERHVVRYAYEQAKGPYAVRIEVVRRQLELAPRPYPCD